MTGGRAGVSATNIKTADHAFSLGMRSHDGYRWYKPLLALVIFVLLYAAMTAGVLFLAGAAYSIEKNGNLLEVKGFVQFAMCGMTFAKMYSIPWVIVTFGPGAAMIPSAAYAYALIFRRSPGYLVSACGKWRWGFFAEAFGLSVLLFGLTRIMHALPELDFSGDPFTNRAALLFLCLCPLQCLAEEMVFRGLVMQSFGSWPRAPLYGNLAQALYFALVHPADTKTAVCIFAVALLWGAVCDVTGGIEASFAAHLVFNMSYLCLCGFTGSGTAGSGASAYVLCASASAAYLCVLCFARRAYGQQATVQKVI